MRAPDFTVGDPPYLRRWYVIPRNNWFNIYLHQFLRSDDDRALHDHPYHNCSILLSGCYVEHLANPKREMLRKPWRPWAPWRLVFRRAAAAHRISLLLLVKWQLDGRVKIVGEQPVWTLFVTGPRIREWGFHCPQGWRHFAEFIKVVPGGNTTGKGCD